MKITFPDGASKEFENGATLTGIAASLGGRLAKAALAAEVNGRLMDLGHSLDEDASIRFLTFEDPEGKEVFRHSASHIMAQAVKRLFPETKLAIGPAVENGYYYDFDTTETLHEEELARIEEEMALIVKEKLPLVREVLTKNEAVALFRERGEIYKVEMIEALEDDTVSIYRQGDFVDMCRGPHIPDTGYIKFNKLLSIAGAYWRGDEHNKMLQRIYGTAFPDKKLLKAHLYRLEEARKRDHRRLGKELELFSIVEEAGPGFAIYHPKGALIRTILEDFERREHLKRGYQIVMGPQLLKVDLWKKSGHFDHYRENMYFTEVDKTQYGIKPMNCLAHMLIYKSRIRSYRDLPIRYFELGTVYRHEQSGVLHGLFRLRGFTQDDAHILCTPEQLNSEIRGVVSFVKDVMAVFGFEYEMEISTRPENSIGTDGDWERATGALMEALDDDGIPYVVNEGDGAFYGPKIDVKLRDAIGRMWQCATIQCDFALPDRFELEYVGSDGNRHRPIMLHRVILGSIDRFLGVLIEHYAGAFPTWLSPVQVKLLTITDSSVTYAESVKERLIQEGIRVETDFRNEKIGFKIRESRLEKVPYMLVIGEREAESGAVAVRHREDGDRGALPLEDFIELVRDEISSPVLP
ncbi:MAG TPA: threonine--tRNA ligase [Proteobacteria bacterium]|nr:threonine--tRNA ligase 2 [bacterium BMS3Abin14]HDL52931.1 threonine--tRNA ligase [Pseudomonadota bacterium]